jgi:hypothetical protein
MTVGKVVYLVVASVLPYQAAKVDKDTLLCGFHVADLAGTPSGSIELEIGKAFEVHW